jgi:hypothetical protein
MSLIECIIKRVWSGGLRCGKSGKVPTFLASVKLSSNPSNKKKKIEGGL